MPDSTWAKIRRARAYRRRALVARAKDGVRFAVLFVLLVATVAMVAIAHARAV